MEKGHTLRRIEMSQVGQVQNLEPPGDPALPAGSTVSIDVQKFGWEPGRTSFLSFLFKGARD